MFSISIYVSITSWKAFVVHWNSGRGALIHASLWFQTDKTRQKYVFIIISSKFQQIQFSFSGHCIRFIFKICQTVAGISITPLQIEFEYMSQNNFLFFCLKWSLLNTVFTIDIINNKARYSWCKIPTYILSISSNNPQFYVQLVFKAPFCITLTISDQNHYLNREW